MKRTLIVFAIIAMCLAGFTSCKDVMKCWHVTISYTEGNSTLSQEHYWWITENSLDAQVEQFKKDFGLTDDKNLTIKKEAVSKYTTEADCLAQNPKDEE